MEGYIAVGKIGRAHGVAGWAQVWFYSQLPDRLNNVRAIYFYGERGLEAKTVERVNAQGKSVLIKLKGVDSREAARELTGKEFWLPEEESVELPEDTYFIHDLIGLKVIDQEGQYRGRVMEVLEMGGNDVYVVQENEEELLIPAVAEFVTKVDLKNGEIQVRLWEEM